MKKNFLTMIIVCFLIVFAFQGLTMASQNQFEPIDPSGDKEIYLNTYEEYENLMQEFDQNEVNKQQYMKQLVEELQEMEELKTVSLYQARVIEVTEPELQYMQNQSTAEFSRGYYQNGIVEIINDEQLAGIQLTYMNCLTYDVYGNITLPEVKVGDIVNISFMQVDAENVVAYSPEPDTYIERFPTMLIFTIVILLVVAIFLGKHSIKLLIPALLIFDILFVVVGPLILEGFNLWALLIFTVLLTTIAICVLKLGANIKSVIATLSTVIISVATIFIHAIIDSLLNFSGLTSESFLMSGGVTPNVIANEVVTIFNFHSLSIAITIIMAFALVALVACKTAEKYEENKAKLNAGEIINEDVKSYIADMSFVAVVTILATALPKYMMLLVKSYTTEFIVHSEMLLIEFVRVLIVLLAMVLTVPMTTLISKFLED